MLRCVHVSFMSSADVGCYVYIGQVGFEVVVRVLVEEAW